jgi:hypothetical protein
MAIRNMMRNLPDGPSAFTIRRVELLRRQTFYRSAESGRGLPNVVNQLLSLIFRRRAVEVEFADGEARVAHFLLLEN